MGQALCARQFACSPAYLAIAFVDEAMCVERFALGCALDVAAPDSNFGLAEAAACAASLPGLACAEALLGGGPACRPPPGGRADGSGCAQSSQCQSRWCDRDPFDTCGVCEPVGAVGAPCDDDEAFTCDVWEGAMCGDAAVCEAAGALGRACSASGFCAEGVCSASNNTCVAGAKVGEDCAEIACRDPDAMAYCDPGTDTCVAFPLAGYGEACSGSVCVGAAYCPTPGNTCTPLPIEGEACLFGCVYPATCSGGVCTLVQGSSCAP